MEEYYLNNITLKVKSNVAVAGTSISGFCTNAAGASLYFTGTECTKVVYTSSTSGSTGYPRESYSTANIVRSIISLDQSTIPSIASFQFHIPDQVPSSMYHKDGNGSYCCVSYQLKLQLGREVVEVLPIQIISKPSSPSSLILPYVEKHVRRRLMLACCIPKGSIETSVKVDNTILGNGGILKVYLELVNNSAVDIKWISFDLFEHIDWNSCSHYTSDIALAASKKVPGLQGIKQRAIMKGAKNNTIRPIASTSYEVFLRVPDSTLHTCTGNMFEVRHYLNIRAHTKCGFTDVRMQVPIKITSSRKSMIRGNTSLRSTHECL